MIATTTFVCLRDALRAGWTVYDRTRDGYLLKQRTDAGWKIGRVVIPTEGTRGTARSR